jgi:calcium-dependent protein kinase
LPDPEGSVSNRGSVNDGRNDNEPESSLPVQNKPPEQITIPKPETKQETKSEPESEKEKKKHKRPSVKRSSSAGLRVDSVLLRETGNFKEFFSLGRKLGQGQFGTTFLCIEKETGYQFACKSIAKRKLVTDEDVEDVRSLSQKEIRLQQWFTLSLRNRRLTSRGTKSSSREEERVRLITVLGFA